MTFVDADGKALQDGAYYYNDETVTAPQAPEKDGCVFVGWNGEYQLVTNPLVVTPAYGCSIMAKKVAKVCIRPLSASTIPVQANSV